jgi:hypothetical protein
MGEEAERFRKRAKECRDLSVRARDSYMRDKLKEIAADLEAEAEKIDAEDGAKDSTKH